MVLSDIQTIFNSRKTDRLSSSDIVYDLGDMEDRPWAEWKNGRPITKAALARLLKPFKIFPRTIRFDSGTTAKGYHLDQFNEDIARYGGDYPIQTVTPSQTSYINGLEQKYTVTAKNNVTLSEPHNSLKSNDCDGVTVCEWEGRPCTQK